MFLFSPINLLALVTVMGVVPMPPLKPCPSSPNCVSSQASDSHFIEAFPAEGDIETAFNKLKNILENRSDTTIAAADDNMIRVEFKTTLGFIDNGIFVIDSENKVIHIRSASRSGYWDFGKNRQRIKTIRREYQQSL
jgi:uncharacterized protein (DUF1499 family)